MRLHLILPRVEPNVITLPCTCPYEDCEGTHFQDHQEVMKPLRDTVYPQVVAHRYKCLRCHRTFRVYPPGVSKAHTSQRVKGLAVMLYLLGAKLWSRFPGFGGFGGLHGQRVGCTMSCKQRLRRYRG